MVARKTETTLPSAWDIPKLALNTDTTHVALNPASSRFHYGTPESLSLELSRGVSRVSDTRLVDRSVSKYLIVLDHLFFHVLEDTLSLIIRAHTYDPSGLFLLYIGNDSVPENIKNMYLYIEELLVYLEIQHIFIPIRVDKHGSAGGSSIPIIEVNNYIDLPEFSHRNQETVYLTLNDNLVMSRKIAEHLGNTIQKPYRKVYLSRAHIKGKSFEPLAEYVGYLDDKRITDEYILEEFFESRGYEVIIPEQKFLSFREQIQYMQTVKVLASLTSSGLANSLLMQDGQHVIEIAAELVFNPGREILIQERVPFYAADSYVKNHTHTLIPSRRDPKGVLERLNELVEMAGIEPASDQ